MITALKIKSWQNLPSFQTFRKPKPNVFQLTEAVSACWWQPSSSYILSMDVSCVKQEETALIYIDSPASNREQVAWRLNYQAGKKMSYIMPHICHFPQCNDVWCVNQCTDGRGSANLHILPFQFLKYFKVKCTWQEWRQMRKTELATGENWEEGKSSNQCSSELSNRLIKSKYRLPFLRLQSRAPIEGTGS